MRHTEERREIPMEAFQDMLEVLAMRDIEPRRTSFRKQQNEYLEAISKQKSG